MSIQYFKTNTPHQPDINFLSIHYHTILQHLTKLSLNIKNIRTFKVICHFVKKLVHANSTFKPYINSKERAYLQFLWQSYVVWNRATLESVSINSHNEETCISERNLYRVETTVLSV